MRTSINPRAIAVTAFVATSLVAFVYFAIIARIPYYPFGSSHCCILDFSWTLKDYARDHRGFLPAGESSPEASLSLLYHEGYGVSAETLRGKTVPLAVTEAALDNGGLLDPNSCGWHYVEGLTLADNPEIAVVWDKVGLGHNGQQLPDGGHEVVFLSGDNGIISGSDWPAFLTKQAALLAARTEKEINAVPSLVVKVRLPTGEVVDQYDAAYSYTYEDDVSSVTVGNSQLHSAELNLYRLDKGPVTIQLTLGDWSSKELDVEIMNETDKPQEVILDMEVKN